MLNAKLFFSHPTSLFWNEFRDKVIGLDSSTISKDGRYNEKKHLSTRNNIASYMLF
jgi:hypothetical protein